MVARKFNEDMRVKIPATLHFMKIGYFYQSLSESDINFNTKVFINRFKPAISKINGRTISDKEMVETIDEIYSLIRNNDLGRSFYKRLNDTTADIKLIDFENIENNDFAVVDELPFTVEKDSEAGSFRPDVTILVNGIPLAFLEVKKPNNEGGIKAEFDRMINKRLKEPVYRKFFNMLQIVSFSNNMEYEDSDMIDEELIRAGSFYTTPNGDKTNFSFFREDERGYLENYHYLSIDGDAARKVLKDQNYSEEEYDTAEFKVNDQVTTPCNRFITSVFDHERFLYFLHYGILYINSEVPQKHIMRYPQFFATRAIIKRLEEGQKRGIIWHSQGSGKSELSLYASRVIRDYYAKKNVITRFFFVVDRLELLRQDNTTFASRYFKVTNVNSKTEFTKELSRTIDKDLPADTVGEIVVVNVQKFEDAMPKALNAYNSNVQRVFFIDEAHRSYKLTGSYFKNLILCDPNAIFIGLTGTPLLSKKERSNLKFGDYIHKYFYDKSIADGYTLRIKREKIDTVVKKDIKNNLGVEDYNPDKKEIFESDSYIEDLSRYIERDFKNFRIVNGDPSIGAMVVCQSNPQAKKMHEWFKNNSSLATGLVMSDEGNPNQDEANKNNQLDFREKGFPDMLIVHYMLTVGYDVERLKKMYLLRGPHAQALLQTISRVNRPYKAPNGTIYRFGYITDFVDINQEYDRTINDYLKELEKDLEDVDGEERTSLTGLVVDIDVIKERYKGYEEQLDGYITADDMETYSQKLTIFNKDTLLSIKRLLNGIKDCYTEFLLSNAMEEAQKIDFELIKKRLRATQERIDFINLKEEPVSMMDAISDAEVVEIFYEFLKTSVSILDLSKYDPGNDERTQEFSENLKKVQSEIKKNRNKGDIRIIRLDMLLKKLFAKMDIKDLDELKEFNEELKAILKEAMAINRENDRLAAIYDDNFGLVKTYQDIVMRYPDKDNKEIESAIRIIYDVIKDGLEEDILTVQGRQGFIDQTKKNAVKALLKSGLYKKLNMKEWIDSLLSNMYTNLQNYK